MVKAIVIGIIVLVVAALIFTLIFFWRQDKKDKEQIERQNSTSINQELSSVRWTGTRVDGRMGRFSESFVGLNEGRLDDAQLKREIKSRCSGYGTAGSRECRNLAYQVFLGK